MRPSKLQILFSFLMFGLVAGLIGQSVALATGLPHEVTFIALAAFALIRAHRNMTLGIGSPTGIIKFDVEVELWAEVVVGELFKNNQFLNHAYDADKHVIAGKVVHIPQSGASSGVVKNRSSLPASVSKRSDTDITYAIDEYTTDPRLIPNASQYEKSYDEMASAMSQDTSALKQVVAENMLVNWAPSAGAKLLRTTGAAVAAHTASATGNRKGVIADNLLEMMTLANADDIDMENRFAMFDAQMYSQLIKSLTANEQRDFSKYYNAETGVVGKLHTWNIMMRGTALVYTNDGTPVVKAYGAAGAADDNGTALFWQKDAVERALGTVKPFYNPQDATYFGDVFSLLLRMGGRKRRSDNKGVYGLVQDASA